MIVRIWRGHVPIEKAEEYRAYQAQVGPPNYVEVPGNLGAFMLGRDLGEQYEVTMLTVWQSWDAIRAFAGDPPDRARYYDRDFEFLIDPPERVEHFDVLETAEVQRLVCFVLGGE